MYYLMALCPEWETDPFVGETPKKTGGSCFNASLIQTPLLNVQPWRSLPALPDCRVPLVGCAVCMCFAFVLALKDRDVANAY